jgi:protein-tyrosine phosphatase
MDHRNFDALMYMTGDDPDNKVSLMLSVLGRQEDVPDPWYTGRFPATFDLLHEACSALIDSYDL